MEGILAMKLAAILACRLGMVYVHTSLIPSTNVNLIVIQHIFNATFGTLCYLFFGYTLSYIKNPLEISFENLIFNKCINKEHFFESWRTMLICEGLISIILAGRAHVLADIISLGAMSIVQAIIKNLLTEGTDLNEVSRKLIEIEDKNNLAVMHILPGSFALGALILYGKRALVIEKIDFNSLSINAQSFSLLGYVLMIPGYSLENKIIHLMIAVSMGMLTTMIFLVCTKHEMDYWACIKILQSSIPAIIGAFAYNNMYEAVYVTFIMVLFWMLILKFIEYLQIEDNCNIITSHGLIGFISLIITPLFNDTKVFRGMLISLILSTAVFTAGVMTSLICLLPFKYCGLFRTGEDKELHKISKELEKIQKRRKGTFQPGSHTRIQNMYSSKGGNKSQLLTNNEEI